jgi:threonylcarbamoyladenosine tRNA methylthiotransferase MtaB
LTYFILTFGCRVNQADSLGFEEALRTRGATAAASPDEADLVLVNTCSVTASADHGARLALRRLARVNPNARLVVTGCFATRRPEEFVSLPNVLRVVPNDQKPQLVSMLAASGSLSNLGLSTAARYGGGEGSCGAVIEPGVAGRTAFTLRVQTGCAQPCSYCIIPSTRGAPRSVPLDAVLSEVGRAAAAGFKEIALTGVHLGSYGRDLTPALTLAGLLKALSAGSGAAAGSDHHDDFLFRISSLEPMDCTPEVVDLVATSRCFAPHFHLPLQHASDRILSVMRRPYGIGYYAELTNQIRRRIPMAAIGSDVIVGFPGETDGDFEQLCLYLERSSLTHLHVFPYSDRPGTEAAAMGGKVHGAVIRERASRVREIGGRLAARFRQEQTGAIHRALTLEDGSLVVTGNYLKVRVPPGRSRNEWVWVRMTQVGMPESTGEIVEV